MNSSTDEPGLAASDANAASGRARGKMLNPGTAFGCPRNFLDNQYVYLVVSPRARGLSVGVNFNPDRACNFDCIYCEVDRRDARPDAVLDIARMSNELAQTLRLVESGGLKGIPPFDSLPSSLARLKHVTVSGDGEPTQCPEFAGAVEAITHLRTSGRVQMFRLVLITNASGFDRPEVLATLKRLPPGDEIWAKLDVGTQSAMDWINRTEFRLESILRNILRVARERPVVIQSLFTAVEGRRLPESEIAEYAGRLKELKGQGAKIPLVQIYSANRPSPNGNCRHLDLRELSHIARIVRDVTGLNAEVF